MQTRAGRQTMDAGRTFQGCEGGGVDQEDISFAFSASTMLLGLHDHEKFFVYFAF
jgi:hypothetical protein